MFSELQHHVGFALSVATIVSGIVGMALHELTHYTTARMLGCEADIQLCEDGVPRWAVWAWSPTVLTYVPHERSTAVDRAVALAPLLSGLTLGVVGILMHGLPSTLWSLPWLFGWGIYTVGGGLEDYSLHVSHGGETFWSRQPLFVRQLTGGVGIFVRSGETARRRRDQRA